jgi:Mn2+/Fe2+ NRAMP family transporter
MVKTKRFWFSTLLWAMLMVGLNLLIDYASGRFYSYFGYFAKVLILAFILSFLSSLFVFKPKYFNRKTSS